MATPIWDGVAADNNFATATNWSSDTAPVSTDNAIFPALAASTSKDVDGSDQSTILLVNLNFEEECYLNFGSRETPLHVDADYVNYAALGVAFLEIDNSTEIHLNNGSGATSSNSYGMNLTGSTNALLIIDLGDYNTLGIGAFAGQSATFTTVQVRSGDVTIGESLTCTTLNVDGGVSACGSNITTVNVSAGTYSQAKNKPTTLNLNGGRVYYNSTTAPTTVVIKGGVLDMSQDGRAKTFAAVTMHPGAQIFDPAGILTITTLTRASGGTTMLS